MKKLSGTSLAFALLLSGAVSSAVESDQYRLLSTTPSIKLILISHVTTKTKYLLDAATAKITVDGKPAEFYELKIYTLVQVKFNQRKFSKEGIDLDGSVSEIKVSTPDNLKGESPKSEKNPLH